MKVPNWLREFFLLSPRPPERPVRRVVQPAAQKRHSHRNHRWHNDTSAGGTPGPEVIRKKVRYEPLLNDIETPWPTTEPTRKDLNDMKFWSGMWAALIRRGRLRVGHNQYYGKLRGVDILIHAKRDFNRAGIPVDVKLCGSHGFISLRETP